LEIEDLGVEATRPVFGHEGIRNIDETINEIRICRGKVDA
jgi:hypothetical protein